MAHRKQKMVTESFPFLYHYQPIHSNYAERLRLILQKQSIYCSSPDSFNDPWDCKPFVCLDSFHHFARTPHGAHHLAEQFNGASVQQEAKTRLLHDPIFRAKCYKEFSEAVRENTKKWRIYCLSPYPTISLMWSHYAHSHTGICLKFSTSNEIFSQAREVTYSVNFPRLRFQDDGETWARNTLLTKSKDWSYASEYRFLARTEDTKENWLTIPNTALISIIVGCNGNAQEVQQIVNECKSSITVRRVTRAPDEYQVEIND